jgi:hypothetical protein
MIVGIRMNHLPAFCVTVNTWPAIVSVPTRVAPPVFIDTLKTTSPLPLPVAPSSTVIQESFEVAVHAQLADVVTEIGLLVPGFGPKSWLVGSIAYVHAAACETANVLDAIAIVPSRAGPEFASTV